MTSGKERTNRILVEAEGRCWHDFIAFYSEEDEENPLGLQCRKCGALCNHITKCEHDNPDFSEWGNFGRSLKILREYEIRGYNYALAMIPVRRIISEMIDNGDIDQIPALVATELARILEEKK